MLKQPLINKQDKGGRAEMLWYYPWA